MADSQKAQYFYYLGGFIHAFSVVEGMMQTALMIHADAAEQTAKAIFSGVRISQASSLLKRIYHGHKKIIEPWLEDALQQLADINAARNDIVHFGAEFREGEIPIVSNASIALSPDRVRSFPVSGQILQAMSADLLVITNRLLASCVPLIYDDKKDASPAMNEALTTPWQYKHVPQSGRHNTPPPLDPIQTPPPRSSRA